MNYSKLVRRNLSRPMSQRVSANAIMDPIRREVARVRGDSLALLETIHAEIASTVKAKNDALEMLDTYAPNRETTPRPAVV